MSFDIEMDGDLDLAVANGRVNLAATVQNAELPEPWSRLAEPNLIYLNRGDGVFETDAGEGAKTSAFTMPVEISRGLVAADLDRDGDQDLVLANVQGGARIFRNDAPRAGDWLQVEAHDPRSERDAIGALISIEIGERTVRRTIRRASSYLSSGPPVAHFTLPRDESYRSLRVQWPDGVEEVFPGGAATGSSSFGVAKERPNEMRGTAGASRLLGLLRTASRWRDRFR